MNRVTQYTWGATLLLYWPVPTPYPSPYPLSASAIRHSTSLFSPPYPYYPYSPTTDLHNATLRCAHVSFFPWSASSTSQSLSNSAFHFISSSATYQLSCLQTRRLGQPIANRRAPHVSSLSPVSVSVSVSVSIDLPGIIFLSLSFLLLFLHPFTLYLLIPTTAAEQPVDTNDKPLVPARGFPINVQFSDPGCPFPQFRGSGLVHAPSRRKNHPVLHTERSPKAYRSEQSLPTLL